MNALQQAGERSTAVLLNCYLREYAEPRGLVRRVTPRLLEVQFPCQSRTCMVAVHPEARMSYAFLSEPYLIGTGEPLDWRSLARLVVMELSAAHQQPCNDELLHQVSDSVARMEQFFTHPARVGEDEFIYSEQCLTSGHTYHPAPKARPGLSRDDLFRYSPELQPEFPLFYFEVRPEAFDYQANRETSIPSMLRTISGFTEEPVLGLHPWQARYLLGTQAVQKAIADGWLRPLGPGGVRFTPTSSVRTLFSRRVPYFFKSSLHLRLTNCVRKNAWYELDTALLLDQHLRALPHPFESFQLLAESAYTTVAIPGRSERLLREGFSTIYRDSRPILESPDPVWMSAALFGGTSNRLPLQQMLTRRSATAWLADYCRQVVWPALYFYAEHGVIFEPHLQNTLIACRDGRPVTGFFRDLEGTKLLDSRWSDRVPRALAGAVLYSAESAWRRFVYCVVFNQLTEVIDCLPEAPCQELWSTVRASLAEYQQTCGTDASRALLERLLGEPLLPVKANLITRCLQSKDRDATYVCIRNPLR